MIKFNFFDLSISPNVFLVKFGIKIGSYPKPFSPIIFEEIFPFTLPTTVIGFSFGDLYVRLHTKVAERFFFYFLTLIEYIS